MFRITLYNFNKLKNSTKRPGDANPHVDFDGDIKEDFSPMALEVTFDTFTDANKMPTYNYAKIVEFKRFYYITAWTYVGGLWVASLVVDALATFRDEIKSQRQYILRSESNYNPTIIDSTYLQEGNISLSEVKISASTFWGNDISQGCVVVGVVGSSGANIGAATHYAMTYAAFNGFMSQMLSSISWAGISATEISQELQKALINPTQYIVSSIWLPFDLSAFQGISTSSVKLGWWTFNLGQTAKILTQPTQTISRTIRFQVPKHPRASDNNGRYLFTRLSPYTRYSLKFLPFGIFDIDTSYMFDAWYLQARVNTSSLTGDSVLEIFKVDSTGKEFPPFLTTEANIGIQLPTGQVAANLSNYKEALTAGAVVGAADLINALQSSQAAAPRLGGTTVNSKGFSHHSGRF